MTNEYKAAWARRKYAKLKAEDPEKLRVSKRKSLMRYRYKLSLEQDAALGNRCAICNIECFGKNRHIDHDHTCCSDRYTCGKCIRGILCSKHNTLLGQANDDPDVLNAALHYLKYYELTKGEDEVNMLPISINNL